MIPQFSDFSKSVDNLFKKQFRAKLFDKKRNDLFFTKFTHNCNNGIDFETQASFGQTAAEEKQQAQLGVHGNLTVNYTDDSFGKLTVKSNTSGNVSGEVSLNKVHDDLSFNVSAERGNSKTNEGNFYARLKASYSGIENFNNELQLDMNQSADGKKVSPKAVLQVSAGDSGFSVGGQVTLENRGKDASAYHELCGGIQYAQDDFTVSARNAYQNGESTGLHFGLHYQPNSDYQFGVLANYNKSATDQFDLKGALRSVVDDRTTTHFSLDRSGQFNFGLVYSLQNNTTLNVATTQKLADASTRFSPSFGIGLTFSD